MPWNLSTGVCRNANVADYLTTNLIIKAFESLRTTPATRGRHEIRVNLNSKFTSYNNNINTGDTDSKTLFIFWGVGGYNDVNHYSVQILNATQINNTVKTQDDSMTRRRIKIVTFSRC